MIDQTRNGPATILRLDHGKANVMDLELVRALDQALQEEHRSDARAVILTGTGSIFSAGVDIRRIADEGAPYVREFFPSLSDLNRTLFFFPKPLIGAANGHAIAGGFILLSACDHRLLAHGAARVGLPELTVGVSYPLLALEMVRFAVPSRYLQDLIYRGGTVEAPEALRRGYVDALVPEGDLMEEAMQVAERMGALPSETFRMAKEDLRAPMRDRAEARGPTHDEKVMDWWASETGLRAIRTYVDRTLR
jgi:enoyl-CoA hydratase